MDAGQKGVCNMTYESKDRQWFALDAGAGLVYALGDCGDFDAAEQVAADLDIQAVWIADADTARQWMTAIAERFEEIV
jgi:hypothetical protein